MTEQNAAPIASATEPAVEEQAAPETADATETMATRTSNLGPAAKIANETELDSAAKTENALVNPAVTSAKVIDEDSDDLSLVQKAIRIGIALAIALASFFALGDIASSPETYSGTIETLDEKKTNVTALAASAAAASTAITLLPDNIGDPIATELADLSSDFVIILAALLLEKYLLTIMGMAAFQLLIPLACALYIVGVLKPSFRASSAQFAAKIALFAVILVAVVPVSTGLADMIDQTFETSSQLAAEVEEVEAEVEPESETTAEEKQGFNLLGWFKKLPETASTAVAETSESAIQTASSTLNHYLEAFAIMMVTSCIIPVLVLAGAIWLVGALFGVSATAPLGAVKSRSWRKPMAEKRDKAIASASEAKDALTETKE